MNREERRETLIEAASRVALAEGLQAMTIRRVAKEAGVVPGQIHHNFSSSAELRSLALIRVMQEMVEMPFALDESDWNEKLVAFLSSDNGRLEPYIRLWREAQILSQTDKDILQAYRTTLTLWHAETVKIIQKGASAGAFILSDSADHIAWRLCSFVCGLDGISTLDILSQETVNNYIRYQVKNELGPSQRKRV